MNQTFNDLCVVPRVDVVIDETLNEVSNLSQYHHHDMIPTYVARQIFHDCQFEWKIKKRTKRNETTTLPSLILIIGMKACNYEFPLQHTLHKKIILKPLQDVRIKIL
jgi:hypothetical protein